MTANLPHPDACPLCGEIHGQIQPPVMTCPQHGHRLQLDLTVRARDTWVCPVWKCPTRRNMRLPEDVPQVPGLLTENIPAAMRRGRG